MLSSNGIRPPCAERMPVSTRVDPGRMSFLMVGGAMMVMNQEALPLTVALDT